MAQHTFVQLDDDIDGSEASETLSFALDGVTYEIDLNDENAEALREAFATYVEHGRRLSAPRRRGPGRRPTAVDKPAASSAEVDTKAVREWAHEHGIQVSDRGRLAGAVVAQFLEAQE